MAVQAQYPSNVLLLNRNEQERAEMELPRAALGFLDQPPALFGNGASAITASENPRKRAREAESGVPMASHQHKNAPQPVNIFSMQPPPALVSFAQLQNHPPPSAFVSTGLQLSFDDQHQGHGRNPTNLPLLSSSSAASARFSSHLSEELALQIGRQKDEIDQFLVTQGEQLRRALAERRQKHYRALLSAAEKSAARRLREKEAEVEQAAQRTAELENRLSRLRAESMAWQTKAMADQATAAALHAQLQQAAAAAAAAPKADDRCGGSVPADDAESAYVDPDRVEPARSSCRACRVRAATVVLLPCRHLCLCEACDAAAMDDSGGGFNRLAASCPVCRCVRTGNVRVFLT